MVQIWIFGINEILSYQKSQNILSSQLKEYNFDINNIEIMNENRIRKKEIWKIIYINVLDKCRLILTPSAYNILIHLLEVHQYAKCVKMSENWHYNDSE